MPYVPISFYLIQNKNILNTYYLYDRVVNLSIFYLFYSRKYLMNAQNTNTKVSLTTVITTKATEDEIHTYLMSKQGLSFIPALWKADLLRAGIANGVVIAVATTATSRVVDNFIVKKTRNSYPRVAKYYKKASVASQWMAAVAISALSISATKDMNKIIKARKA